MTAPGFEARARRTAVVLGVLFLLFPLHSCAHESSAAQDDSRPDEPLSLTEMLSGGTTEGFARAIEPRTFRFPEDHGPHEDFRTEWWYLTGNLTAANGRRFGYQFTLFRNAMTPERVERDSTWATRQVYMAHFALTDPQDGAFHAFERFSRGAAGLAGVEALPFRAWLDDWEIRGGDNPPPFQVQVTEGDTAIELVLEPGRPAVLNGDRGLSQKGREPGNASYYYSLTRMPTRGTVTVGYKTFEVQGSSWLDREWSTSVLEEGQIGWDWFALQLSDGRDLMVYQLRRSRGEEDELSSGSLVDTDGTARRLRAEEFDIEPLGTWTSPATNIQYPSKWRLRVPTADLDLQISPLLPDQELNLSFRYWEGAVSITGTSAAEPVTGQGYVELTGYE